jgi:hypothetical protein
MELDNLVVKRIITEGGLFLLLYWMIFKIDPTILFPIFLLSSFTYLVWSYDWIGILLTAVFYEIAVAASVFLRYYFSRQAVSENDILTLVFLAWFIPGLCAFSIWLVKRVLLWVLPKN